MTDAKKSGSERKAYRYTYTGYDGFGRTAWTAEISQEAEPTDAQIAKHKISYSYDTEDKITEVTYALAEDGRVESLHYAYDKNQYLIAIKAKIKGSDEEKLIRKYRYNERGKLFTIVDFTDYRDKNESYVARFYEYDALDRVSSMTYKSGTTVLEAYTYSYDKNNNIIKKTEKNSTAKEEKDHTDQTTEYTYNALGRLTKSVVTDHKKNEEKTTTTYSYDSAGNRTKKVKGEEETAYTYNGLNQLLKAKTTKGDTLKNDIFYEYDVNGNQIKETDKETGDSVENTYDVENRLSTATVTKKKSGTSGNETVSLTQENLYNGEGQRIQKKEAGEVTNYFYEDGMVSYTTGADTGEKLIQNLSGLEDNVIYAEQKVTRTDGTASVYQDFLYTKDIQGSTSSILNKDTKGELSYEYDDFGETSIHGSSALKNEICYTGGIYDESTRLYYLNARYYDPENGRFLSEDTYRGEVNDPDTLHLYAYCKNNPINYVDPSGHKYSPQKAADYGYKWGKHPNPKYYYDKDKDCTNFVSQCVHAGGKKMNRPKGPVTPKSDKVLNYWYAVKGKKKNQWSMTYTWRSVKHFFLYWRIRSEKVIVESNFSKFEKKLKIGDIVQLYKNDREWYHSVIISRKIDGEFRYAGHTNNHSKNPVKKLKKGNSKWRIIRIK